MCDKHFRILHEAKKGTGMRKKKTSDLLWITQNAMMQTIQCKLFSYNISNYNGTYFLMRQKNTKFNW